MKFRKLHLLPFLFIFCISFIIADFNRKEFLNLIGHIFLAIGVFLNCLVVCSNNFKMPVYYGGNNSRNHFRYTDKKKIKFWILSDWIYLMFPKVWKKNNKNKDVNVTIFSIGDIFITLGLIIGLIGLLII